MFCKQCGKRPVSENSELCGVCIIENTKPKIISELEIKNDSLLDKKLEAKDNIEDSFVEEKIILFGQKKDFVKKEKNNEDNYDFSRIKDYDLVQEKKKDITNNKELSSNKDYSISKNNSIKILILIFIGFLFLALIGILLKNNFFGLERTGVLIIIITLAVPLKIILDLFKWTGAL